MEIYIELAVLENFLIDAMLLWLSLYAAKRKIRAGRIVLSSLLGAAFAVFFPLVTLPVVLSRMLKLSVGALLVYGAISEKGWGRYAITVLIFYGFSFCLAGLIFALSVNLSLTTEGRFTLSRTPLGGVVACVGLFVCFAVLLVKKLYKRRRLVRFVYPCALSLREKTVKADGLLDSGNRARVKGRPLCFLSPELVYDLLGDGVMSEEAEIVTVSGKKRVKIFQADRLEIYCGGEPNIIESVYCSPSPNIRARDYKIIVGADALEGGTL